jgi:cell division transport system permease protein
MGPRGRYLVNEVGIGLRRNPLVVIATIVTVTLSLALLGVALLVQKQIDLTRDLLYAQVEVSIFLLDGIPESQKLSLEQALNEHPVVDHVIYESKEDAYNHFVRLFEGDDVMIDSVTPEILPASFRVKLLDPEQFAVIESQFSGYPGVDEVSDQREVLDRFFQFMNALRRSALTIAFLQIIAAAALISNTIRMTAFARREQTGIMKLVGATNWYIRLPFVAEGMVAGLAGGLLAGALLMLGYQTIIVDLRSQIQFMPFIRLRDVIATVPLLLLIGAAISAVASFFSLRRFLAV